MMAEEMGAKAEARVTQVAGSSVVQKVRAMLARRGLAVVSIVVFVLLWHVLAVVVASPYLPRPLAVGAALLNAFFERDFIGFTIGQHVTSSLTRILIGFSLAAAIAVPVGLGAGYFRWVEGLASPMIEVIRPIPPLAWIPFAIYFFGDPFDAVFIVMLAVFFPVYLSTVSGIKAIDPILIDAARTLGAKGLRLFVQVVAPAALGSIATGMRIGLGVGWMCIMAAEMVGVRGGGLGVYIMTMSEIGRFDAVFAGMALIGAIGFALTGIMGYAQRALAAWNGGIA